MYFCQVKRKRIIKLEEMDFSTENVTTDAAFVIDILNVYKTKKEQYHELFAIAEGYRLNNPNNKVPIKIYNDICEWIETNLGKFNLIIAGKQVGETLYNAMVAKNLITKKSIPIEVIEALNVVNITMVQDPKRRIWEILEHTPKSMNIRKTQTFNGKLQIGVLESLVKKTGVFFTQVFQVKDTKLGAEFDEYNITWM
ncbi:MAG: hypothetical protein AUJ97_01860 [Bacteroidetes bacterium CG2_30_32_10]|nr:MAG: hypothetical protein AUJ97_01860 [Bacteroidetes bacterium CG2_30_32_10]